MEGSVVIESQSSEESMGKEIELNKALIIFNRQKAIGSVT